MRIQEGEETHAKDTENICNKYYRRIFLQSKEVVNYEGTRNIQDIKETKKEKKFSM